MVQKNKGARRNRERQHGRKVAHPTQWEAWAHIEDLAANKGILAALHLEPYPCWWGERLECGQVYPEHWHVGHPTGTQVRAGHLHHPSLPCGETCG